MTSHTLNRPSVALKLVSASLVLLLIISGVWLAIPADARHTSLAEDTALHRTGHDVVLLVREPQHLSAALKTAKELRSDATLQTCRIEIIVCGKASSSLQAGSEMEAALREAAGEDVVITACGMSLKQTGIDPATLIDIVQVVPNGLTRALQLQAEGYLSVEL